MGKPSRRRGPLHLGPRLLRLRMGERARQIRRSAKHGRSRVTSSSKVEAASMSDKCEIQLDADPIQGASSGPGQVSQVSNFEATHRGPSSRPPLDLLNIPDEFKSLETYRLLPCDLKNASSSARKQYNAYIRWFYSSYGGPARVASQLPDIASKYLEVENSMTSLWVDSHACSNPPGAIVADCIYEYMDVVLEEKGEIEHPYAFDAAECLAKEAELICEWLRRGRKIFTDDEYALCHKIRAAAAELFISRRKWSIHISAALVGIRKETEWLIGNLKRNSAKSISTSMKIRRFALDFLWEKFAELEPFYAWGNEELSEVAKTWSDVDESDDDDDVADNSYLRVGYDEAYMIPYRGCL